MSINPNNFTNNISNLPNINDLRCINMNNNNSMDRRYTNVTLISSRSSNSKKSISSTEREEFRAKEEKIMRTRIDTLNKIIKTKCYAIWDQYLGNKTKPNDLNFEFIFDKMSEHLDKIDTYEEGQHKDSKKKWWNNQKASEMAHCPLPQILDATDEMAKTISNYAPNDLKRKFHKYIKFVLLETAITGTFMTRRSGSNDIFLRTSFQYARAGLRKKLESYFIGTNELKSLTAPKKKKKDTWLKLIKAKRELYESEFLKIRMDYKQQFGNTFSMGLDYMPKRENINNKSYNFFGKSEDIKPNIIHNNGNCGRYGPIVSRNNFFSDISGNICHNIQCQQRSRKYEMEINRLNEEVKKLKIEYKHFENENAKLKQTIEWLHLNKSSIIPTCDIDLQHNLYNNNGINGYNLFNNNDNNNNNNDRIIPMQTYNPIYNPNETHFNDTNGGITMPMLSPNSPNDTRMIIKTNNNIIIHNHSNNGDNSDLTSPMAITPKNHKNSILNNSNNINPFLSNNNNNNNRQSFPKLKRQNTVNNLNIKHSSMDEMSIHTSNTDNQTMTTNVSNTKITNNNNNNNNNRLRNNLLNNRNNNNNNIENIISPELPNLNSFSRSSNLPLYNPFPSNMSTNIPPNIPGNISTNISRSYLSNGSDPNTIRSIPSSFRSSNESLSFNNIHHPFLPVNEPF